MPVPQLLNITNNFVVRKEGGMIRKIFYGFFFYFVLLEIFINLSIAYPVTQSKIYDITFFVFFTIVYILSVKGISMEAVHHVSRSLLMLVSYIMYAAMLLLVNIYSFNQYLKDHSPFPGLWHLIAIALLLNFFYLYYFLKLNLVKSILEKLYRIDLIKKIDTRFCRFHLSPWVGLVFLSIFISVFFQKVYPGIPNKLQAPVGSIAGCAGTRLVANIPVENKTLQGKIATEKGQAEFIFIEKPVAIKKNIDAHVRRKDIDWGKKLRSINSPIMEQEALVGIELNVPKFKSTSPVEIVGYVRRINATYPKRTKNGFRNESGRVQTKKIKLYVFPKNLASEYNEFIKNRHRWWQLPVFYFFTIILFSWSFVELSTRF